jgi:hypothetical protein
MLVVVVEVLEDHQVLEVLVDQEVVDLEVQLDNCWYWRWTGVSGTANTGGGGGGGDASGRITSLCGSWRFRNSCNKI